jgi:hypothetical protein
MNNPEGVAYYSPALPALGQRQKYAKSRQGRRLRFIQIESARRIPCRSFSKTKRILLRMSVSGDALAGF